MNAALTMQAGLHKGRLVDTFSSHRSLGVRNMLHSARKARRRFQQMRAGSGARARSLLESIQRDLSQTQQNVEAEVGEFITSPHLLFKPLSIALAIGLPLTVPLAFMPTAILIIYSLTAAFWYLIALCVFATEVAMRPPWYKKGLGTRDLPPYWKGFIHDPFVDLARDFEDVEFKNAANVTLRGWFIPAQSPTSVSDEQHTVEPTLNSDHSEQSNSPNSSQFHTETSTSASTPTSAHRTVQSKTECARNMVVCVHGAGRDRRNFLRHSAHFLSAGWSVLLFDLSEHGLSDGANPHFDKGTAFGEREQHDVIAAVEYLYFERNASNVAIVGTSAGASSAILAAARRPELSVAVVAENPFTRPDHLLIHHLNTISENYLSQNSTRTVRSLVFWLAGRILLGRLGQILTRSGAVDVAPKLTCPLLIAHSVADDIVPYSHGREIYEAAHNAKKHMHGMTQFLKVEDAAHCALYDKDPKQWTDAVVPFLQRAFDKARPKEHSD